jgi:hypothetical protein
VFPSACTNEDGCHFGDIAAGGADGESGTGASG